MNDTRQGRLQRQRGAVLIVALVLLLVLTVLGTAGLQDTTMEERMAGNFRDLSVALQAAETALRAGESIIASTSMYEDFDFDGSDGSYDVALASNSYALDEVTMLPINDATIDPNNVYQGALADGGHALVHEAPSFFIERLPGVVHPGDSLAVGDEPPATYHLYRVTARGIGVSPNTEVILQSTYHHWKRQN